MARCGCSGQAPSTLVAGLNMAIDGVGLPDDPYILSATSVIETAPSGGGDGAPGPEGPAGPAGGGPVAAARFEDPEDATLSYGSGGIRPSALNTDAVVGDPSCWVYDGTFGVRFAVEGWYQASADGHVYSLNDGDELSLEVILHVADWFGEVIGFGTAKETGSGPGGSDVWLSATSTVFYAHVNDYVEMSVNTVDLNSSTSVIERCGINLVRFMNAIDITGGGGGASNVVTGTGAGLNPISITKTLPGSGNSVADSDKSIAIGDGANVDVTSLAGIAIGSGAYAFATDDSAPLAIGWDAAADGGDTVAVGNGARAAATRGTAVGSGSFAGGAEAVAVGRAQANGAGSIAIGSKDGDAASASTAGDIAIGGDALARGGEGTPPLPGDTSAIAIGADSYATSHSVSIGENTTADVAGVTVGSTNAWSGEPGQVAIGHDLIVSAPYSTVVGYRGQSGDLGVSAAGNGSVAVGAFSKATGDQASAVGRNSQALDNYAVNVGSCSDTTKGAHGRASVAIGADAKTTAAAYQAVALGRVADAEGSGAIAIGAALAQSDQDIAIGVSAQATGGDCVAVGNTARATGDSSIAAGGNTSAGELGSIAIGGGAYVDADADYGVALGYNASVRLGSFAGVAIGQQARALGLGTVAIGCDAGGTGASTFNDNDFTLGTSNHNVKIAGRLTVAQRTPSSSADTQGAIGDITTDGNYVYVKTAAGWKRAPLSLVGSPAAAPQIAPFSSSGVVAVKVGGARYYVEQAMSISTVRVSVGTAPTGAAILVDVNKNGTTIYTTQANRPQIAVSTNTATGNSPNVTTLAAGDYLTVDIDQVGSTVAGSDLTVQIGLI